MKNLNKNLKKNFLAASVAFAMMGSAMALPSVTDINTRVGNILDKIGVDGGFNAGDFTSGNSNDLGNFSAGSLTINGTDTAQDIANTINAFNVVNTTVYVPVTLDNVNDVRDAGLESMLLNALAFKIDEITGDVGQLTNSYSAGKLAFETALNNGDAIIAPSAVDYSNADAQTWFGVKNSLDIFTASANAWKQGIAELNGDMNGDGTTDTGRVSHFDGGHVVGAEVADYDADQDATSDEGLQVSTFDANGVATIVNLDLGHSYDRDKLAAAAVVAGSTTSSERNAILSGETIFGAARHANDSTGFAASIVSDLDSSTLTQTVNVAGTFDSYYSATAGDGGRTITQNSDGTWTETVTDTGQWVSTVQDSLMQVSISGGAFDSYIFTAAETATTTTVLVGGALDDIKNSEMKSYAEDYLTGAVDTSSPQWLQDLNAGL